MDDSENENDEIVLSADKFAPDYSNVIKPEFDEGDEEDSEDEIDYERTPEDENKDVPLENIKVSSIEEKNLEEVPVLAMKDDDEDEVEDDEDIDDDDDDDEEDNDEILKKLDRDIDNDIILKHHPEIIQNNYQEILALCKIVRNDKGIIVDELHKTYPFITKYEYARIIGMRAKQINNGADPFIQLDRGIIDGYTIAMQEMKQKKIPFIIARPLPNGGREYWKLQDLELIHF